ncbi:MAG: hypothetical protein Q4B50_07860 [Bacillota bacterium]|nr:hypothetical protein [Bacillota bacterium]
MLFSERVKILNRDFYGQLLNMKSDGKLLDINLQIYKLEDGYKNFTKEEDDLNALSAFGKAQQQLLKDMNAILADPAALPPQNAAMLKALRSALKEDVKTTQAMQEAATKEEGRQILNEKHGSMEDRLDSLEMLVRGSRAKEKNYDDIFSTKLQSLSQKLQESAEAALYNSAEFKEMHAAMQACSPEEMQALSPAEKHSRLDALTQKAASYLSKKSVVPKSQRGRERVELAQDILSAAMDLKGGYWLNASEGKENQQELNEMLNMGGDPSQKMAKNEKNELFYTLSSKEYNAYMGVTRCLTLLENGTFGNEKEYLKAVQKDDELCTELAKMEYMRILKQGVDTPKGEKGHVSLNGLRKGLEKECYVQGIKNLKPQIKNHLMSVEKVSDLERIIYGSDRRSILLSAAEKKQQQPQQQQQKKLSDPQKAQQVKSLG